MDLNCGRYQSGRIQLRNANKPYAAALWFCGLERHGSSAKNHSVTKSGQVLGSKHGKGGGKGGRAIIPDSEKRRRQAEPAACPPIIRFYPALGLPVQVHTPHARRMDAKTEPVMVDLSSGYLHSVGLEARKTSGKTCDVHLVLAMTYVLPLEELLFAEIVLVCWRRHRYNSRK